MMVGFGLMSSLLFFVLFGLNFHFYRNECESTVFDA